MLADFSLFGWLPLVFVAALADAGKTIVAKYLVKDTSTEVVAFIWILTAAILFLPLWWLSPIPWRALSMTFWLVVILRTLCEIVALLIYLRALQKYDVTVIALLTMLVPAFVLVISIFLNHQLPSLLGFLGLAAMIVGSICLEWQRRPNKLTPIMDAKTSGGPLLMMVIVCALWGLTTSLHKIAIAESNANFYTAVGTWIFAVGLLPVAIWRDPKGLIKAIQPSSLAPLTTVGILNGIAFAAMIFAQTHALNAYVIGIKLAGGSLLAVLLGAWLLKESLRGKGWPTVLFLLGVALMAKASS